MEFGLDTVIVALIGALATMYGIREARAGRRDAVIQQAAANKLAAEKQELEALRYILDAERAETDRARIAREQARAEADHLRTEADEERRRRVDAETALRLAEEQARRAQVRASKEFSDLAALVRDEVLREAGKTELIIEQAEDSA